MVEVETGTIKKKIMQERVLMTGRTHKHLFLCWKRLKVGSSPESLSLCGGRLNPNSSYLFSSVAVSASGLRASSSLIYNVLTPHG